MGIMSAWLVLMLLYQLCISFFGFKRNTKNYQDHDPQMRQPFSGAGARPQ